MRIRQIRAEELESFAALSPDPDRILKSLTARFKDGESSPELCFVAEDGDFKAGIWFSSWPTLRTKLFLWDLFVVNGSDDQLGSALLNASLNLLKRGSARCVEAMITSKDLLGEAKRNLYAECGFVLYQTKSSYELNPSNWNRSELNRLRFLSLKEIGGLPFISGFENVMVDSLDRSDQLEVGRLGAVNAANELSTLLQLIDSKTDFWSLGQDSNGIPIGFVIPQTFSTTSGAINYIGVLPGHRGKGYGADLLSHGIGLLWEAGLEQIFADIDHNNPPMLKQAKAAGFIERYSYECYTHTL